MPLFSLQILFTTIVAGFASHVLFCHYEPSMSFVIMLYVTLFIGLAFAFFQFAAKDILSALAHTMLLEAVYSATLLFSIGFYRLFFHRCRHFPGPTFDILCKWSRVPLQLNGRLFQHQVELFKTYGDVVRVGPRDILLNDPIAMEDLYGARSYLGKGSLALGNNQGKGTRSMMQENDKVVHKKRRQLWEKSFVMQSLRSYQKPMLVKTLELMEQLHKEAVDKSKTNGIALDHWFQYWALDMIGQLGFMRDFHMVQQGSYALEIRQMFNYLWLANLIKHIYYVGRFLQDLRISSSMTPYAVWCVEAMRERVKLFQGDEKAKDSLKDADFQDIFGYILQSNQESTSFKLTSKELVSDTMILVMAGSETTSSALSMLVYYLAKQPHWTLKIRNELRLVFQGEEISEYANFDKLTKECPILNACINEILRLWPPVFAGQPRETPKDAPLNVRLSGNRSIVIPKNTSVMIPIFALHRDPRNFSRPDEFRPERWLETEKEEAFNAKAYVPFSYGPRNCVGKQFAYEELRTFMSQFIMRFDVHFAPGFDDKAFIDGIIDMSVQKRTKPLLVNLTPLIH